MLLVIVQSEGFTKLVVEAKVVMKIAMLLLAQGKSFVVTSNLMRIPFTVLLSKKGSPIVSGGLK